MTNEDYFEAALHGDPKDVYGYERNLDQFLMRMAARREKVEFGFRVYQGAWILVASTSLGNYEFIFDQEDKLVIDQVL